jgi:hypothetical protein
LDYYDDGGIGMRISSVRMGSKCGLQKEKDSNSFPVRLERIIVLFVSGGVRSVLPLVKIGSKFSANLEFFCTHE